MAVTTTCAAAQLARADGFFVFSLTAVWPAPPEIGYDFAVESTVSAAPRTSFAETVTDGPGPPTLTLRVCFDVMAFCDAEPGTIEIVVGGVACEVSAAIAANNTAAPKATAETAASRREVVVLPVIISPLPR